MLVAEMLVDHGWSTGCVGGLSRSTWFGAHVVIGLAFLFAILWATPNLKRVARWLVVLATTALGGFVYLVLVLYYAFSYRCDYF